MQACRPTCRSFSVRSLLTERTREWQAAALAAQACTQLRDLLSFKDEAQDKVDRGTAATDKKREEMKSMKEKITQGSRAATAAASARATQHTPPATQTAATSGAGSRSRSRASGAGEETAAKRST